MTLTRACIVKTGKQFSPQKRYSLWNLEGKNSKNIPIELYYSDIKQEIGCLEKIFSCDFRKFNLLSNYVLRCFMFALQIFSYLSCKEFSTPAWNTHLCFAVLGISQDLVSSPEGRLGVAWVLLAISNIQEQNHSFQGILFKCDRMFCEIIQSWDVWKRGCIPRGCYYWNFIIVTLILHFSGHVCKMCFCLLFFKASSQWADIEPVWPPA